MFTKCNNAHRAYKTKKKTVIIKHQASISCLVFYKEGIILYPSEYCYMGDVNNIKTILGRYTICIVKIVGSR